MQSASTAEPLSCGGVSTLGALTRRHWPVVAAAIAVVVILLLPEYRFGRWWTGRRSRPTRVASWRSAAWSRAPRPSRAEPLPTGPVDLDPFPGISYPPFDPDASFTPVASPDPASIVEEPPPSLPTPEGDLRVLLLDGPDAGTEIWAFLGMAADHGSRGGLPAGRRGRGHLHTSAGRAGLRGGQRPMAAARCSGCCSCCSWWRCWSWVAVTGCGRSSRWRSRRPWCSRWSCR